MRRRLLIAAVLLIAIQLAAPVAQACAVCYGAPDDPMTKGMNNGIWVLLGVVGFVQLGFIALFWTFWKRARDHRRFREQFHVVHSTDPTSFPGGSQR
jgi:hypothetical protein